LSAPHLRYSVPRVVKGAGLHGQNTLFSFAAANDEAVSATLAAGSRPRDRGALFPRKNRDPRVKTLEREKAALATQNRRLERRLQRADTIIAFQKKVAELLGIPLNPPPSDEDD
jgi:hypothetical protein